MKTQTRVHEQEHSTEGVKIVIFVATGLNVPYRTISKNIDGNEEQIVTVKPYVQIKHGNVLVYSFTSTGTDCVWNEELSLELE